MKHETLGDNDRPNIIARSVAGVGLSLRSKLLIAFLGITCLLVGLVLFGLTTLQHTNARSEAMLRDQKRIEFFDNVYVYLGDLYALNLALHIDERYHSQLEGSFAEPVSGIIDRVGALEGVLGRSVRQFGQEGMPDAEVIATLRADLKTIKPAVSEIDRLWREGEKQAAAEHGLAAFYKPLRVMQRNAYSQAQQIEEEMRDRGKATRQAYVSSRQNTVAAASAAIGAALLLGYSISSSLLWPIDRIRRSLQRLAGGQFDDRVTVPNRDELGELASHVNDTSAQLGALYNEVEAQKAQLAEWNAALEGKVADQVDEIERANRLRRFLPPQVAKLIVEAPDAADALATRKAEITVLFADLRGFSAYANMSTPDDVVGVLNAFHSACGPLIDEQGGTLERFLGDGLMVLFGAPLPQEDAAARAMALATAMQGAVRDAIAPFQSKDAPLGLGIGIGTGPATLGQIGFEGRLDYSAIGPAPNLAARLCDKAADGQILLSHATVWQIEAQVRQAGTFDLKGIGENIAAFELERPT